MTQCLKLKQRNLSGYKGEQMLKYGKHFSEYRVPSFSRLVEQIRLSVIYKHTTLDFTWITKEEIKEKTFLVF